jgi:hypothetical protein
VKLRGDGTPAAEVVRAGDVVELRHKFIHFVDDGAYRGPVSKPIEQSSNRDLDSRRQILSDLSEKTRILRECAGRTIDIQLHAGKIKAALPRGLAQLGDRFGKDYCCWKVRYTLSFVAKDSPVFPGGRQLIRNVSVSGPGSCSVPAGFLTDGSRVEKDDIKRIARGRAGG